MAMNRVVAAVCVGVFFWGGCEQIISEMPKPKRERKEPIATTGVLNVGLAGSIPAGTANARFLESHGIVLTNDGGSVLAIRDICTHDGYPVDYKAMQTRFECQVDRCEYDLLGKPTRLPATKPLNAVRAVEQADGTLTVDLTRLYGMPVPIVVKK